jgi:nucleoside-diphosphate-sugar epimerase
MSANHVVFGTGAIGHAIMEELLTRGESVRMVNRTGLMDELPAGVELVAADLYDPARVREVTRGAKVVYQSAQPHYHEWPEKFPPLQQAILDGLSGNGSKLVIVENTYMYGAMNGSAFTEASPCNAHTRKGKVRAEMSRAALAAHAEGKLKVTIGRGSDFFGPWGLSTSMGDRVFYPLLQGKPAQLGGRVDMPHTHTFLKDFGKALVILGERPEADGQAWHVPNDMPRITQGELVRMFGEQAGVEAKMSTMGKFMLQLGGLFIPAARESVEMLYEFEGPYIVDSSKFERAFGMQATPMREAIKETVAWFKSHPQDK